MKELLIKRLANLLSIKSLVTLAMTGVLVALLVGDFHPSQDMLALYCTSYGAVITYFFTRKDA